MRVLIPKQLTNARMLGILKGLRIASLKLPAAAEGRLIGKRYKANAKAFASRRKKIIADGGFIEYQDAFDDMRYGLATVRHSGCEVIAAYNVLRGMTGRTPDFAKLIATFEKRGMILYGGLGTDPGEMKAFFMEQGFSVEEYTDTEEFLANERQARDRRAYVLTFYNDRENLLKGIHTVAVTLGEDGFYLHNDGGKRAFGPYGSIGQIVLCYDRMRAGMISILRISC
ncbi:MAG: hypothetical protein Q4A32_08555 [Lachnospiraceae bacterium]|nr:hypothetical protein [Lachnospiraceae bacterium]